MLCLIGKMCYNYAQEKINFQFSIFNFQLISND
jgi:hypothetical protein